MTQDTLISVLEGSCVPMYLEEVLPQGELDVTVTYDRTMGGGGERVTCRMMHVIRLLEACVVTVGALRVQVVVWVGWGRRSEL
mgnify:CR=1 FL=1